MPTQDEVDYNQQLLEVYRRNLSQLLLQQAQHGGIAFTPLSILNSVEEARDNIRRIKATLRSWGLPVYEDVRDEEQFQANNTDVVARLETILDIPSSTIEEIRGFESIRDVNDPTLPSPRRFYLGYLPTWS